MSPQQHSLDHYQLAGAALALALLLIAMARASAKSREEALLSSRTRCAQLENQLDGALEEIKKLNDANGSGE